MKRRRKLPDPDEDVRPVQLGTDETRRAMEHASGVRDEALRRDKDVQEVARRLREVRERNHFGELITQVLRHGR